MKTINPMSESVSGVKGDSEAAFRKGYINISKYDIGLGNVDDTADNEKNVASAVNDDRGQNITQTYIKGLSVSGKNITYTKGNGATASFSTQDTTYGAATTSANGLMTAAMVTKLNGIAAGAQVNSVTGIKGNAESSYRTGNVNITPANIGLGNVNNTADSAKSVSYAASAGKATNASGATFRLNNSGSSCGLNTDNNSLNLLCGQLQVRTKNNGAWSGVLASAFALQSSRRYKTNIETLSEEQANKLLDLKPVRFDYIDKVAYSSGAEGCLGMIAEDVEAVQEWGVVRNAEGEADGIDYAKFVPQLIRLCQMQQKEIDILKEKVDALGALA